ncbi:hypothetical protein FKM82_024264 [Ascaphus truei]
MLWQIALITCRNNTFKWRFSHITLPLVMAPPTWHILAPPQKMLPTDRSMHTPPGRKAGATARALGP